MVLGADQIVSVASAIRFQYSDNHTFISWETGMNTNPAIWISVFLVAVVVLNMIPVKVSHVLEGSSRLCHDLTRSLVLWRIRIPRRMHQNCVYHNDDSNNVHSERHEA